MNGPEWVLATVLTVLALVGGAVGVTAAVRSGRPDTGRVRGRTAVRQEEGLRRVTATVHTGWEQTLIRLVAELQLPTSEQELGYGRLYLQAQHEQRLLVRSRSTIGRGFIGAIDLDPHRTTTGLRYAILQLPGDETLQGRVLEFELQLISALRRVDRNVDVQLAADALRDFERRLGHAQRSAGEQGSSQ